MALGGSSSYEPRKKRLKVSILPRKVEPRTSSLLWLDQTIFNIFMHSSVNYAWKGKSGIFSSVQFSGMCRSRGLGGARRSSGTCFSILLMIKLLVSGDRITEMSRGALRAVWTLHTFSLLKTATCAVLIMHQHVPPLYTWKWEPDTCFCKKCHSSAWFQGSAALTHLKRIQESRWLLLIVEISKGKFL